MFGKTRVRFKQRGTPAVWVLIEIQQPSNVRYVTVYMHEWSRKIYSVFERRKFSHTRHMNEYIASLGEGVLVMVVDK